LRQLAPVLMSAILLWPGQPALAQFTQFGDKLVGTGAGGNARQGNSVALSGDGTTAIVGGPNDNMQIGAAWVFTRGINGGVQQGAKLVGTNNVGSAQEGTSIALSADGNTAIVGGPFDNNEVGAAWVFTRSGSVWNQQGAKLVGTNAIGNARQGTSVALSADGNTALVGGPYDGSFTGAAWVFTRSGGTWTQQAKLLGTGAATAPTQGSSVALSADGNTALVGGPIDNGEVGATWVFTRSGSVWTQQGPKLFGVPTSQQAFQGQSVALSADGNTAILGGPYDGSFTGAAWVFTRSGGTWTQQSGRLVGTDAVGSAQQGQSVALSADGNIAAVGGWADNNSAGAAWFYTRSNGVWAQLGGKAVQVGGVGTPALGWSIALSADGKTAMVGGPSDNASGAAWLDVQLSVKLDAADTHDFDNDAQGDIAWRHSGGTVAAWLMSAQNIRQTGTFGVVPTNWQIVGQRDFNNDGTYDFLWRDGNSGTVAIWLLNGLSIVQSGTLGAVAGNWQIVGTSDFNLDGRGDILWRDSSTGTVAIWLLNGLQVLQTGSLGAVTLNWSIAATDGKGKIFWRDNNTGAVSVWNVYGFEVTQSAGLGTVPLNWTIAGVGDFDANGSTDILWRDTNTGTVAIWLMNGLSVAQAGSLGVVPSNWSIAETGDFNTDGMSDILWRDSNSGTVAMWFMNGLQISSIAGVGTVGTDWTIQGLNAD
jgi:hypothetical protein